MTTLLSAIIECSPVAALVAAGVWLTRKDQHDD